MLRVLHLLPHRGGGAETYIDLLEAMPGVAHRRVALSASAGRADALRSLPGRVPSLIGEARAADLVHAHGDAAAMLGLPLRPRVITTHGLHLVRRAPAVRPWLIASVAAAAVVLCTSEAERSELLGLLPARLHDRLVTVPNGIEPVAPDPAARAAARAALGLVDGDVAGLYLGELSDRKDPLVAVRAAGEAGPPFVLLVAGDGPLAPEVRAAEGRSVRALGFRDDPETLLAAADVFVLPSRREGLSFAVLEAMGHGLAMVVADGAGNPEAVGDAGLVLPAGDERAFAGAHARLAADPALRASLGAAAKARVEERFTAGALRAGVRTAYDRAAGR